MSSSGFHSALLQKEKNRQDLAAVLERNYAAEARNSKIRGIAVLSLGVVVSFYLLSSGKDAVDSLPRGTKAGRSHLEILSEVKKQIKERDKMFLGEEGSAASAPLIDEEAKEKRPPGTYADNQVPINLYSDLNSRQPASQEKRMDYRGPLEFQRKKVELLAQKSQRRIPPDYGRYRPGEARDLPKLPSLRRGPASAPSEGLYRPTLVPPMQLSGDVPTFPRAN